MAREERLKFHQKTEEEVKQMLKNQKILEQKRFRINQAKLRKLRAGPLHKTPKTHKVIIPKIRLSISQLKLHEKNYLERKKAAEAEKALLMNQVSEQEKKSFNELIKQYKNKFGVNQYLQEKNKKKDMVERRMKVGNDVSFILCIFRATNFSPKMSISLSFLHFKMSF